MGVKVTIEDAGRPHRRGPSVRTPNPKPVTEDEVLGALYGIEPATAHQRKLTANRFTADVVRLRREAGDTAGAASYARPVEIASEAWPERQGPTAFREETTDAEEDVLQARYRANECEATARPLLRKRAEMRACSLADDVAIAARFGITL